MYIVKTKYGNIGFEANNKGICKIVLNAKPSGGGARKKLADKNIERIVLLFNTYFSGKKTDFDLKYDITHLPEFTQKVLKETKKIPYGKTLTYGEIARKIGHPKASRAVGQALGANPLPILIPCHRVMRKDQTLGGFAYGLKWKKLLLYLEENK